MEYKIYNPDETNDGFEAKYKVQNGTLYYMGYGANSFWDWMRCVFGSLLKPVKRGGIKFQPEWYLMAFRFYHHIMHVEKLEFNRVIFSGHSMGGAVGKIIFWLIYNDNKYKDDFNFKLNSKGETYGSPKPFSEPILEYDVKDVYNKGDFIPWLPMWFKPALRYILNKKWRPVWKSHADYKWELDV